MLKFRFARRDERLYVADKQIAGDGDIYLAPLSVVENVSVASFSRAILEMQEFYSSADYYSTGQIGKLYVSDVPEHEFSEEYSIYEETAICILADGRVVAEITTAINGADLNESQLASIVTPMIERARMSLIDVEVGGEGTQGYCDIRVTPSRRGVSVRNLIEFGRNLVALLSRLRSGELTAWAAWDLVLAGHAELLIGSEESPWLEVKSRGYSLDTDIGRIELAQDIARFANGDSDGLLVIGFRTRRLHGAEVITKRSPALEPFDTSRYHRSIDAKLFPPVQGLQVRDSAFRIANGLDGHLLAIFVPQQPEEAKPFLVHGAVVRGKVEGAFISIVQRRGEHSVPVTAAAIHSTLAAGRALLRRGVIDPTPTTDGRSANTNGPESSE